MQSLFTVVRDICLLRRGPQDLPYSTRLLAGICIASVALQLIIAQILGIQGNTIAASLFGLGFTLGVLYVLLSLRGVRSRFVQAASALLACALLFSVLSLPIALLSGGKPPTPENVTPLQLLLGLVSLPIVIWKIVIDAHILRNSLNLPFFAGLVIAIFWLLAEMKLGGAMG